MTLHCRSRRPSDVGLETAAASVALFPGSGTLAAATVGALGQSALPYGSHQARKNKGGGRIVKTRRGRRLVKTSVIHYIKRSETGGGGYQVEEWKLLISYLFSSTASLKETHWSSVDC